MKIPNKKIRDKIMCDIVFKYRENQKRKQKIEKVNLFPIFLSSKLTNEEFMDVIYSLDAKKYIKYHPELKSKDEIEVKGEKVHQEFVSICPDFLSFPEDLKDNKTKEINTNIKTPLILQLILMILTTLGTILSLPNWINTLKEWFLSLIHS